jgi:hypothetical protein
MATKYDRFETVSDVRFGVRSIPHLGGTRPLAMGIYEPLAIQIGVVGRDDGDGFGWWLAGHPSNNDRGIAKTLNGAMTAAVDAAKRYDAK